MNYFSHNPLNRFSELRADPSQIELLWQQPQRQVLVLSDMMCLVERCGQSINAATLPESILAALAQQAKAKVYLGSHAGKPYFALGFEGQQESLAGLMAANCEWHDLKSIALELPEQQSALFAYAKGMVHWNLRHVHCPDCGRPTQSQDAGHVRQCSSDSCGKLHFPRTDTAVIMLISEGDACLLGRQAAWPEGMYATLAGFLEPGETLEQAVARETLEETGVALRSMQYHSSQPWPFPSSIMVGFSATAVSRSINLNQAELQDAKWFTRDQILAGLRQGTLRLPGKVSISYRLISDWFNTAPGYTLP